MGIIDFRGLFSVTMRLYIFSMTIHILIQILSILYLSLYVLIFQLNPEILCADIRLCSDNGFPRMKYNFPFSYSRFVYDKFLYFS